MRDDWWRSVSNACRTYTTRRSHIGSLAQRQRDEVDAVAEAIKWAKSRDNGREMMIVIDGLYLKKDRTISGAANRANISRATANRYHREFMEHLAELLGYI